MSKVQAVSIDAIYAGCLGNVCCYRDDEGNGDVLEYKEPGPLIKKHISLLEVSL